MYDSIPTVNIETATTDELLTLSQADAHLAQRKGRKGRTGKRSNFTAWLIRNGKLNAVTIAGKKFVRLADVNSYQPARRGRVKGSGSLSITPQEKG